jgi:hypothetical protein
MDRTGPEEPERRVENFLRDFFDQPEGYSFGIITQRGYRELENRLTEHTEAVAKRFHRWFIISLVAFSVIALTSAAGLVGFGVLLKQQGHTTHAIQKQRTETVLRTCEDQNRRNESTTQAVLRRYRVERAKANPARRARLRDSVQFTLGLINALAPEQNCSEAVKEATGK